MKFCSEMTQDSIFQTTNGAGEDGDFRREQRPGLGLKRPRFSMKPTKKPSVESLLPTLDLDSLKDPAEFFLAHERLENAKREIQKQLGDDNVDLVFWGRINCNPNPLF